MLGAEGLLENIKRLLKERLGVGQAVGVLEQQRQIVEGDGDVGVILAETGLFRSGLCFPEMLYLYTYYTCISVYLNTCISVKV